MLDGDIEYHDPAEPSTNLCPLLPGQMVNVLDVPVQDNMLFEGSRNISSSILDSQVFTLDPRDKYLRTGVRRASTTSAVHAPKTSLLAPTRALDQAQRNGPNGAGVVSQTSKRAQSVLISERRRSLLSVFHQMRQTRSAGSNAKSNLAWPRKIFSRDRKPSRQVASDAVPETAKQHDRALSPSLTRSWDESESPNRLPSTAVPMYRAPTAFIVKLASNDHSQSIPPNEQKHGLEDGNATFSVRESETSSLSSYHTPIEQLRDTLSYLASTAADKRDVMVLRDHLGQLNLAPDVVETFTYPTKIPLHEPTTLLNVTPPTDLFGALTLDSQSPKCDYPESLASYADSANFSPCLASNTTCSEMMSPCHLSQPETPIMSEFGDELPPTLRDSASFAQKGQCTSNDHDLSLARPLDSGAGQPNVPWPQGADTQTSHGTLGGFQGYSLPNHDHAYVPAVRERPSLTFRQADGASSFGQRKAKQDLVHSWNDGSQHHMTALGELVDDLGYLGKLIT